jgi:hypothetical protein
MMVTANQLANNAASIGIVTLKSTIHQQMLARWPNNLLVGHSLQIYIMHNRLWLNKDVPREMAEVASN